MKNNSPAVQNKSKLKINKKPSPTTRLSNVIHNENDNKTIQDFKGEKINMLEEKNKLLEKELNNLKSSLLLKESENSNLKSTLDRTESELARMTQFFSNLLDTSGWISDDPIQNVS